MIDLKMKSRFVLDSKLIFWNQWIKIKYELFIKYVNEIIIILIVY